MSSDEAAATIILLILMLSSSTQNSSQRRFYAIHSECLPDTGPKSDKPSLSSNFVQWGLELASHGQYVTGNCSLFCLKAED